MERDLPILKSAGEVMKRFADVSSKVAKGVAWSGETERMAGWVVSRGGQRCALESVMGVRSKGRWYVRLRATNKNVNVYVANGGRMYVAEFVDVEGRALQMVLNETEVTTFMETRGGRGEFGVGDMAEDDNPALTEAERLNEIAVDQASDAITPSNIAILALPMVMSLIPVAFLADLNTCATLMYILVTDVFASLPFMIKGVELMASGTVRRGETVAYHVGSVTDSVMEVWSAECSGDESFRVLGLVFICVAASVIILGVLLEALAWRKMRGGQQPVEEGPFGEIFFPDGIVGRDDEWLEEPGEDRFDRTGWRRRRWRRDAEYEGFG